MSDFENLLGNGGQVADNDEHAPREISDQDFFEEPETEELTVEEPQETPEETPAEVPDAEGKVNIPGIGEMTPAEILHLQRDRAALRRYQEQEKAAVPTPTPQPHPPQVDPGQKFQELFTKWATDPSTIGAEDWDGLKAAMSQTRDSRVDDLVARMDRIAPAITQIETAQHDAVLNDTFATARKTYGIDEESMSKADEDTILQTALDQYGDGLNRDRLTIAIQNHILTNKVPEAKAAGRQEVVEAMRKLPKGTRVMPAGSAEQAKTPARDPRTYSWDEMSNLYGAAAYGEGQ